MRRTIDKLAQMTIVTGGSLERQLVEQGQLEFEFIRHVMGGVICRWDPVKVSTIGGGSTRI